MFLPNTITAQDSEMLKVKPTLYYRFYLAMLLTAEMIKINCENCSDFNNDVHNISGYLADLLALTNDY